MVGRSLDALFPKEEAEIGDVVLQAEGLTRRGVFSDVSFEVRRGEIVGLAGLRRLRAAPRSRAASSAIDRLDAGQLWIEGRRFRPRSPRAALRRGLAYLPEDRLQPGARPADVRSRANAIDGRPPGAHAGRASSGRGASAALARRFMEQLRIKATSPTQVVSSLSGGNQQKVVLSKWLAAEPRDPDPRRADARRRRRARRPTCTGRSRSSRRRGSRSC